MAKNQKHYTPKFKQQIVDLYNTGGYSYPQLKREYGVSRSTLSGWVKQLSPIKVSEVESVTLNEYNDNKGTVPDDKETILNRDFRAVTINQKWCTDITYIYVLKEGWTYLASVMDLCSRKIIGYAYAASMTADLALEAVCSFK